MKFMISILPFMRVVRGDTNKGFWGKDILLYTWLFLLAIVNTILNSLLLVIFNNTIRARNMHQALGYDWAIFIGALFFTLLVSKIFQRRIIRITQDMLFSMESSIVQKLRMAPLQEFEKVGIEKVYTALNDIRLLGNMPGVFVNVVNLVVMLTCGIVYFLFIYFYAAITIIVVIGALLLIYYRRNATIEKKMSAIRNIQDEFYELINDLLFGFREIKMSSQKNRNFYSRHFIRNRERSRELAFWSADAYLDIELIGRMSWFLIIAACVYLFPVLLGVSTQQTAIFLLVILYLTGPVNTILNLMPNFSIARISLERLVSFWEKFAPVNNEGPQQLQELQTGQFQSLHFESVFYRYDAGAGNASFQIGPIDLTINSGEVIFVVGNNGSGKSTLLNLLTGLYKPTTGHICYNGQKIDDANLQRFRDKMAAIFPDPHFFSRNYEEWATDNLTGEIWDWVDSLSLTRVFDPTDALQHKKMSKGQQKRLAMLYLIMENKELLALDEWAAEQDSYFRAFFYENMLDVFRRSGKTVIAVTHDDLYFDKADRILQLKDGLLTDVTALKKLQPLF